MDSNQTPQDPRSRALEEQPRLQADDVDESLVAGEIPTAIEEKNGIFLAYKSLRSGSMFGHPMRVHNKIRRVEDIDRVPSNLRFVGHKPDLTEEEFLGFKEEAVGVALKFTQAKASYVVPEIKPEPGHALETAPAPSMIEPEPEPDPIRRWPEQMRPLLKPASPSEAATDTPPEPESARVWPLSMFFGTVVTPSKGSPKTWREWGFPESHPEDLDAWVQKINYLKDRVRQVARQGAVGTYIVGRSGGSKTFTVKALLEEECKSAPYRNGHMTPMGLYKFLHSHRDSACVIDDVQSLFSNMQSKEILLAALGGEPGEPRPVHWVTAQGQDQFQFNGGLICISNVALSDDPLNKAVGTRVKTVEHEPTAEMVAAFMRDHATKGWTRPRGKHGEDRGGLDPEQCVELIEFLIKECAESDRVLDLRMMGHAYADYFSWLHDETASHWQDLVRLTLRNSGNPASGTTGALNKSEEIERESEVAMAIYAQFPGRTQRAERREAWAAQTGKDETTLRRRYAAGGGK